MHYCGSWPDRSLKEIRQERDRARSLASQGTHPGQAVRAEKIERQTRVEAILTAAEARKAEEEAKNVKFVVMFEAWLADKADGPKRNDGGKELRRSLGKHVFPLIGDKPVRALVDADMRAIFAPQVAEGKHRTVEVIHRDLSQCFKWAAENKPWKDLLADRGSPLAKVKLTPRPRKGGMKPKKVGNVDGHIATEPRGRVLTPPEIVELRAVIGELNVRWQTTPTGQRLTLVRPLKSETELALWIQLGTMCRIGELLMTRWEHVNLDEGIWRVPAENTKTKQAWTVYMSDFVKSKFKALHKLTRDTPWCFPSRNTSTRDGVRYAPGTTHVCVKSVTKQVGDRQQRFRALGSKALKNRRNDDSLVLTTGANGDWTPHDLRRTGYTALRALGFSNDVADLCSNHTVEATGTRGTYDQYDYEDEMREAWESWGDLLDALLVDTRREGPLPSKWKRKEVQGWLLQRAPKQESRVVETELI